MKMLIINQISQVSIFFCLTLAHKFYFDTCREKLVWKHIFVKKNCGGGGHMIELNMHPCP